VTSLFDDPRLTTAGLLYEAHDGLIAKLAPTFRHHGLSGLDVNALMRLSRSPARRLRMSDLAAQTWLSTSGVTRLVDRLSRAGLVDRQTAPGDRRSTFAVLTPDGERVLSEVLPAYLTGVERWFTGLLTEEQLTALTAALRIVRDAVHPDAALGAEDEGLDGD